MRVRGTILALAAVMATASCGDGEAEQTSALEAPAWMLTIVAPRHGEQVGEQVEVELALTGRGAALDWPRAFQVGYFVDDALVLASPDLAVSIDLPLGAHVLRVAGVDEAGRERSEVSGDKIQLIRLGPTP